MQRLTIYFGLLYLCLIALSWPAHLQSGDNQKSIATAEAIVNEGTLLIDDKYQAKVGSRPHVDIEGKTYSRFGIGLAIIYIPVAFVLKLLSSLGATDTIRHVLFSAIPVAFGITNCGFVYLAAKELGGNRAKATIIAFISSVYTLSFRYTVHDHSEIIQACFFMGALMLLLKQRQVFQLPAFCLLSATVLIKDYNIAIVGLYGLFAIYLAHQRKYAFKRSFANMGAPVAIAVAIILILNYVRYGGILTSGYGNEVFGFSIDYFKRDYWKLLFSFEMGVFTFNPILLISVVGLIIGLKNRNYAMLLILCSFGFLWLLSAFFYAPKGAWSLGPRYIVPILPLLSLGLVFLNFKKRSVTIALIVLLTPAAILSPIYVLQKTQEYDVIRFNLAEDAPALPAQINGLTKILRLKVTGHHQIYPASAFTRNDSTEVYNLEGFETYQFVNTWYSHLATRQKLPIRLPLLCLHLALFMLAYISVIIALIRFPSIESPSSQRPEPQ
jgi:hypothetical protein